MMLLLLLLLLPLPRQASFDYNAMGRLKNDVRKFMKEPRVRDLDNAGEPAWGETWQMMLHYKIDDLCSLIKATYSMADSTVDTGEVENPGTGSSPHLNDHLEGDQDGFKIALVGDSTMEMQADFLFDVLLARNTTDGQACCVLNGSGDSVVCCIDENDGRAAGGAHLTTTSSVFIVKKIRVNNCAVATQANADVVYFGCGLHLLQLFPYRPIEELEQLMWVYYDRFLDDAVRTYRAGDVSNGVRVPMEVVFMTTHSIAVERFVDDYEVAVKECGKPDTDMMATCLEEVDASSEKTTSHPEWDTEYELRDVCTHGCLTNDGVMDLNRRAESVMERLDVPIVPAYDFTRGQVWATARTDGRHYPGLVPLELFSLLTHVTTALRQKLRADAATGGG